MSKFAAIRNDLWMDDDFLELSPQEKYLYLYLLTGPMSNMAGYYKIRPKQIALDTGIPEKEILPMLLNQKKLWKYSEEVNQVLIPTYLKYNRLGGPKTTKSLSTQIKSLSKCELHKYFFQAVQKYIDPDALNYFDKELRVYVRELCKEQNDYIETNLYNLLSQ